MEKLQTLKEFAVKTVLLELTKICVGRGMELRDKPMFVTTFTVDMETDLERL